MLDSLWKQPTFKAIVLFSGLICWNKSSDLCKAYDKLSMFSVTKFDKIKCPVIITFVILEGLLTSKHLAITTDESVPWYRLTRRVGGVSAFKLRWAASWWPWPLTPVVIVNEGFCIIDYLILKDIVIILFRAALHWLRNETKKQKIT